MSLSDGLQAYTGYSGNIVNKSNIRARPHGDTFSCIDKNCISYRHPDGSGILGA